MRVTILLQPKRLIAAAGVAVLGASALASCAEADEQAPLSQELQSTVVSLAQVPRELDSARLVVERDCLQKEGFDVPFSAPRTEPPSSSITGIVGLMPNAVQARSSGYATTISEEPDPIAAYAEKLAPNEAKRFMAAEHGPAKARRASLTLSSGARVERSTAGCTAKGFQAVYGSVATSLAIENFGNELLEYTDAKAAAKLVKRTRFDYEQCMADAGYLVTTLNAAEVARQRFGTYRSAGEAPKALEARMAEADARCQAKIGLVKAANELFFTKAAPWIASHEQQILGWHEQLDAAKERARKILSNG